MAMPPGSASIDADCHFLVKFIIKNMAKKYTLAPSHTIVLHVAHYTTNNITEEPYEQVE
jgi:hypothetical protein